MDPSIIERLTAAIAKDDAHSWERAAGLLGVTVAQVQNLISGSQLKLVDMFVTDRSFEEFCRKHGGEINTSLMDPATAKWLASEYGVSGSGNGRIVSRAQKHALVTRRCKCGRDVYKRQHLRLCLTCGHVGCCDSSKNKHATKHFHKTQHPCLLYTSLLR